MEKRVAEAPLREFVRARLAAIVEEWEARARHLPGAEGLSEPALRDHVPSLLDAFVNGADPAELDLQGEEHAAQRLAQGYDIAVAAGELAMLRAVILEAWDREAGAPISVGDVRELDDAIDRTIVRSVERFVHARERTLSALDRVSSAALGTGDLEKFLPRLLEVLLETTTAADSAWVLLREGDRLRVRAAAGPGAGTAADFTAEIGRGFAGLAAARREPVLVRDAAHDPMVENPGLRQLAFRAAYAVPLVHEGEVVGVAQMASRSAYDFSEEDQQLFRAMAQRATSLIVQAQLIEAQRRVVDALEHGDAFFMLDRDWRYVLVNRAQERLSRKPRSETLGRRLWDVWPDIARPDTTYWREYHRCMDERVAVAFEDYFEPLDLWTEVTAYPTDGGGIAVFFRDATERKRAERERRRAEELLRQREWELNRLFAITPDVVCVAGLDGRLRRMNPAFTTVLGWSEAEARAQPLLELVHPDDRDAAHAELERLREGAHTLRFEVRVRCRDGEHRWIAWNASPDPETAALVAVGRDVTDEKRRAELEQQLLGVVGHDLRSPLAAIAMDAGTLARRAGLDERAARSVARIRAAAERAGRITADLVEFTRARFGHGIPVSRGPADLTRVALAAVEELRLTLPGVEVRLDAPGEVAGEWDPTRLSQLVTNLLSNAAKYGAPGEPVKVRVGGDAASAWIEVWNAGVIAGDVRPKLFEPFPRGASGGDVRSVGLGLFITREIARAHGGTIEVRSSEPEGTTFTVRLPRAA